MALHGKVAARYARAMMEWLGSADKVKRVASELLEFGNLIAGHSELKLLMSTGVFSDLQRQTVLKELFEKVNLSPESARLVRVTADLKRLNLLPQIALKLTELQLKSEGIVPVTVASQSPMGSEQKKQIEAKFGVLLGGRVEASYHVDPKLVGGVKVTANGKTYDGTVSGWLGRFEEILVGGNV